MYQPTGAGNLRWMVLMTDGEHNAGTIDPRQFIQSDAVPDFDDKGIRLYSIGYTTAAGGTAVDLLQDLAENALNPVDGTGLEESQFAQAPVTVGFEKDLTDTFLDAMATSIGLDPTFDPPGVLTPSAPVAIHEFNVSPFDTGVGVFVDWQTRSADRVRVALISPRCERFEQEDLASRPDFRFRGLEAYAHAYISRKALEGADIGQPRYGTWRLELRLVGQDPIPLTHVHEAIAVQPGEPYKFNIFNRSGLRMTAAATGTRWFTGQTIELVARLRANGAALTGARVMATVTGPTADYGSLLAGAVVHDQTMKKASHSLQQSGAELAGSWAAKAQAVAMELGPIDITRITRPVEFQETSPGVYRAKVHDTWFSGVYALQVVATGEAHGSSYRRERAVSVNVEARPHPGHTILSYAMLPDKCVEVRVLPRDAFDNAVVFDPGLSSRLGIAVQGAKAKSAVINRFDGSYAQTFCLDDHPHPGVLITWDGEPIGSPQPLPVPDALGWMQEVVEFEKGGCDGKKDDPKKALGPVKGPDDPYVSFGAEGQITLARKAPFKATYLAVFTHRDNTVSYEVLVRPVHEKCWHSLGYSSGGTQVFAVPKHVGPVRRVKVVPEGAKGPCLLLQGVGYGKKHHKPLPK
jgi:hypothetical protein